MIKSSTTLTTLGVQKLLENFNYLKARYEHIRQDLKDTTISSSILSIKRLEREFLIFDMRKIKKSLAAIHTASNRRGIQVRYLNPKSAIIRVAFVGSLGRKTA